MNEPVRPLSRRVNLHDASEFIHIRERLDMGGCCKRPTGSRAPMERRG